MSEERPKRKRRSIIEIEQQHIHWITPGFVWDEPTAIFFRECRKQSDIYYKKLRKERKEQKNS